MQTRIVALAVGAAMVAFGGCNKEHKTASTTGTASGSRTYGTTEPASAGHEAGADTAFLQDVGMGGQAEVELSNIALRQSDRQDVRDFAQTMVDDHGKANNQVMDLARARSITLPSQPDTKHRDLADRLMNARGTDFDNQYIRAMIEDHEQTIAKFEHEAQYGADQQVRNFAQQTLPTLRHHLDMARALQNKSGMQGATPSGMQGGYDTMRQPTNRPTQQPANQQPSSTPPSNTQPPNQPGNEPAPGETPASNPRG